MRRLTSAFTIAAGSVLLAATATFAAPADGIRGYHTDAQAADSETWDGHPGMAAPSPYGPLWAEYPSAQAGAQAGAHHGCQCGHRARGRKSSMRHSMRKMFDKFSSSVDRMFSVRSSRGCDCGGCAHESEPNCGAECESACDAMGPAYLPGPPMEPMMMHPVPPTLPVPTDAPRVEKYPSLPADPFLDDAPSSARRPQPLDSAYYVR